MLVLLYSFHIKRIFSKYQMTQLLRYYIRMGWTRKSNCALTPNRNFEFFLKTFNLGDFESYIYIM